MDGSATGMNEHASPPNRAILELEERRETYKKAHPQGFFLDTDDPPALEAYAKSKGWLSPEESLASVERAGEGNMNLTLRLRTHERTLIVKQARPWVEKYPQIEAPAERGQVEALFYEVIATRPALRSRMPRLLGSDTDSGILVLEDLGTDKDFTRLYAGDPTSRQPESLSSETLDELIDYLADLHRPFPLDTLNEDAQRRLANRNMRALNHEHIFDLPTRRDNGLELDQFTEGLRVAAETISGDRELVARVEALGATYLADGPSLLHGDFFPGSWLDTGGGVRIIDPEFCFLGPPSFDLGVFMAHLRFCRMPDRAATLCERYLDRGGSEDPNLVREAAGFAGIELIRRLIGVAQLPMVRDLAEKKDLLSVASEWIRR